MCRAELCGPVAVDAVLPPGRFDIGFKRLCVSADVAGARLTNDRMGAIDLLDDHAGEAGEIGQFAGEARDAEVDMGQEPLQRIVRLMMGASTKSPRW